MNVSIQLRVIGRVQGVGYRESMRARADALGVTGWVRNRRDGSVEALLQGPREAVEALIAWARRGPPAAHVAGVETAPPEAEFDQSYAAFERLPSV